MRFYATHLILFVNFSTGKIGWLLRSLKVKKEKKRIQHLFPYRRLYTELLDADIRNSPRIVYRFFLFVFLFSPSFFWNCQESIEILIVRVSSNVFYQRRIASSASLLASFVQDEIQSYQLSLCCNCSVIVTFQSDERKRFRQSSIFFKYII